MRWTSALLLLIALIIVTQMCVCVSGRKKHKPETVEIDPILTPRPPGDDLPKPLSPEELSPEMIKNLKASIPEMKAAPGVDIPGGDGFDFQKLILEQLEKQERLRSGEAGTDEATSHSSSSSSSSSSSVKLTLKELAAYDGRDPSKPLYISIRKRIYDVSKGAEHYGVRGEYHFMAGKEIGRALATGCFETSGLTSDTRGLSPDQTETVNKWVEFMKKHYRAAGWLKGHKIHESDKLPNDHCPEGTKYADKEPM